MAGHETADRPLVEARSLSKSYGGAQALRAIDVTITRDQVHALVGENGAGKSTLGKIVAGALAPSSGRLFVDGEEVSRLTPREAIRRGITIIEQELTLLTEHTVAENVFLGFEPRRAGVLLKTELEERFATLQARVGFDLDPGRRTGDLRVADQQKVEILRALARDARLIVMDEPTAALTRDEAARLLDVIRRLRDAGTTVIYVSHNLADVLSIADTVTILKDGRLIRSGPASQETPDTLVTGMLGRSLDASFPSRPRPEPNASTALSVRGLTLPGAFADVSFDVAAGEILGITGLIGSGRSEIAHAIFGAARARAGEIEVNGRPYRARSPREAIAAGIALIPESRKDQGLLMGLSVGRNLTAAQLDRYSRAAIVRVGRERADVRALVERLDIRPTDPSTPIALLSGGNQQKVLFGKWLLAQPSILIADEPTRGVDVGARRAIYDLVAELAINGTAVILISSELEEVMHLSNRILVMRGGRLAGEFPGDASEDQLMRAALAADAVPSHPRSEEVSSPR